METFKPDTDTFPHMAVQIVTVTQIVVRGPAVLIWGCLIFSISKVDGDKHTMNTGDNTR
jgi:hypothetical protein